MQRRYDALLAEIVDARRDEARGFDRKYEAADEVLRSKLFLLSPYGTAQKWVAAVLHDEYRTGLRNIRIARYCSPDEEMRWGTTKLDAVLTYLDAQTHGSSDGVKVALASLRIPVTRDGKTVRTSLEDATVVEILAAAKRTKSGTKNTRRSPVERAFAKALAGDKELRNATVRVHDGKVSFGAVSLTALERFAKALRAVDWRSALGEDVRK